MSAHHRIRIAAKPLACLAMAFFSLSSHADGTHKHWNYERGHEGPMHWAELDPSFETCGKGQLQSPIDIRQAVKATLPALQFTYNPVPPNLTNNGHTIQVNVPPGQTLTVGDQTYELLQFHFHTPSEEAVNGKRAAMVAHFVHKNAAGQLGVIGVLIQPGKTNAAYAPVFDHLPRKGEHITVDDLQLNLGALLPANKAYYQYAGSLTTPPCSEGVNWMVLKEPVRLGAEQIKTFRRIFNANARPIQPGHGRLIKESE